MHQTHLACNNNNLRKGWVIVVGSKLDGRPTKQERLIRAVMVLVELDFPGLFRIILARLAAVLDPGTRKGIDPIATDVGHVVHLCILVVILRVLQNGVDARHIGIQDKGSDFIRLVHANK